MQVAAGGRPSLIRTLAKPFDLLVLPPGLLEAYCQQCIFMANRRD